MRYSSARARAARIESGSTCMYFLVIAVTAALHPDLLTNYQFACVCHFSSRPLPLACRMGRTFGSAMPRLHEAARALIDGLGIRLRPRQQSKLLLFFFAPTVHAELELFFFRTVQRSILAFFDGYNVSPSASRAGTKNSGGYAHVVVIASTEATGISPSSEVIELRRERHLVPFISM